MDERAAEIERLYRTRYAAFRNTLATITGSREAAHDVVQETFARALRKRRTFRGDGPLEAWVWRIAFRTARELGKQKHSHAELNGSLDPQLPEPERDPDLARAVGALSPKRRLIVFLHYFADLPYAEIARVCRISEGTVAATLAQARAELHQALGEEVRR